MSPLELRVPPRQGVTGPGEPDIAVPAPQPAISAADAGHSLVALEVDRVVPPSGNLQLGGQQVWLGPALAGRTITIWVDETSLHVLLDGARLKTLPSRLNVTELARMAADGARPAGPSPLPAGTGTGIEVERMVNAAGLAGQAGAQVNVGFELAGQRVTLRMDGTQMAVIGQTVTVVPRTTSREIHRYKAAAHSGGSGTWGLQDRSSLDVPVIALRPVADSDLGPLFDQMRDPESVRMAAFTP